MFNRDDRHIALPATIALAISVVCIWASQARAQSREFSETKNEIALQSNVLEAKCDRARGIENDELNLFLKKLCVGGSCLSRRVRFDGHDFFVEWSAAKFECGLPASSFKTLKGIPLPRQELIDQILGYPCLNMRTRRDLNALYKQCGRASDSRDVAQANGGKDIDLSTIAEINQVKKVLNTGLHMGADEAHIGISSMTTKPLGGSGVAAAPIGGARYDGDHGGLEAQQAAVVYSPN